MVVRIRHRGIHRGKMRGPFRMLMVGFGFAQRRPDEPIRFGFSIAWWSPKIDNFCIVTPFGVPYMWT